MVIVPSIDVRGARVAYPSIAGGSAPFHPRVTPSELAERYVADGALELHLVDRDAAERGDPANLALLTAIARRSRIPARLAGGISSVPFAEEALEAGFAGVLFSSAVFGNDDLLRGIARLGRSAIVELEAREGWLSPRGGDEALAEVARGRGVLAAARAAVDAGIRDLYVIDLDSEGALAGPALGLLDEVRSSLGGRAQGVRLHTGGGISSLADISALARWGVASAVVGRALLERRFTLVEAMAQAR